MTSILKTDEIQSQNGGSVVKIQTLKHPSASGNNLELGSDGTTTVSGALTASGGIANAGTISAGTIGGNVGFPTGKILQVIYADRTDMSNKTISTTGSYVDGGLDTGAITQKQTGSKILVEACVTMAPTGFTSNYYRAGYFAWNTSNSGNYSSIWGAKVGKAAATSVQDIDLHQYPHTTGKWYVDTPSSSFTIYLTFNSGANNGVIIGGGNYHTSLTVYEIAQ